VAMLILFSKNGGCNQTIHMIFPAVTQNCCRVTNSECLYFVCATTVGKISCTSAVVHLQHLLCERLLTLVCCCSKEANGIVFCSKDDCHSYEEEWPTCAADKGASDCIQPDESDWKTQYARPCGHTFRSVNFPLSRSKDANKMGFGRAHLSPLKTRQNYMQKNVSSRLIAPTLTSLAKLGSEEQKREDTLKSVSTCHVRDRAVISSATHLTLLSEVTFFSSHFS